MTAERPIVSVSDFSWSYEGSDTLALDDVSFEASPGECVILCGKSGCGKSTLAAAINGLIPHALDGAYAGSVEVAGVDVLLSGTYDVARHVGSVFQDPRSQFFTTTTTDEVAFGCENLGLPPGEISRHVNKAFSMLGADALRDRSIFDLSSGQKQLIAIASAVALDPEVVVMDEPSANLDNEACETLSRIIAKLKEQGRTVIIAEHRLSYLMEVVDRIVRMDAGRIVEEMPCSTFRMMDPSSARARGLRMPDIRLAPIEGRELLDACTNAAPDTMLTLDVRNLAVSRGKTEVLCDASFSCASNVHDVVAIIGKNGAGKTTLARTLAGLTRERAGEIRLNGEPRPSRARTSMAAFVMQDADYQLFTESVETELRFARTSSPELDQRIDSALERLELSAFRSAHPLALSGGQKQRVTIACAIVGDGCILLLDEPTSGLDGESMREVAALVRGQASKGSLVLIITHDFEFIASCCTRALVVAEGHIADDFAITEATRTKLCRALGLLSPLADEKMGWKRETQDARCIG